MVLKSVDTPILGFARREERCKGVMEELEGKEERLADKRRKPRWGGLKGKRGNR